MDSIYNTLYRQLDRNRPFAVATILSHKGSTPRTSGTRMAIFPDRTILGTIGGGTIEAEVINACAAMLADGGTQVSKITSFVLDTHAKAGLDMICGGELRVWMEIFGPGTSPDLKAAFREAAALEQEGLPGLMVSELKPGPSETFSVEKALIPADGAPPGTCDFSPDIVRSIRNAASGISGIARLAINGRDMIIEPLLSGPTLYIFGGGHVGWALAQMAHLVALPCVVVDDREEFANALRFPHARSVHAIPGYDRVDSIGVDENSYVVILTRGHLFDERVLEQALNTPAAYIGMIGSRRKRDIIYANLLARGVDPKRLKAVFSPIGLDIYSETPAEIAVSVIAQIIQCQRGKGNTGTIQIQ
ncbi:MAG: XdhC family protein [Desulfobacter sp.]